jgi:hypothetical protein
MVISVGCENKAPYGFFFLVLVLLINSLPSQLHATFYSLRLGLFGSRLIQQAQGEISLALDMPPELLLAISATLLIILIFSPI